MCHPWPVFFHRQSLKEFQQQECMYSQNMISKAKLMNFKTKCDIFSQIISRKMHEKNEVEKWGDISKRDGVCSEIFQKEMVYVQKYFKKRWRVFTTQNKESSSSHQ